MRSAFLLPLVLLPGDWSLGLLLLSALVLGLPHGAADLLLARRLAWPMGSFFWRLTCCWRDWPWPSFSFSLPLASSSSWAWPFSTGGGWRLRSPRLLAGRHRPPLPLRLSRGRDSTFPPGLCRRFCPGAGGGLGPMGPFGPLGLGAPPPVVPAGGYPPLGLGGPLGPSLRRLGRLLQHSWDSLSLVGVRGRDWLWVYLATLGGLILALALYPRFQDPLAAYMAAVYALTVPHALTVEAWLRRLPPARWPLPGR